MDVDSGRKTELPAHLEKARTRVSIGFKKLTNAAGTYGARTYQSIGYDNSLDLGQFLQHCVVRVREKNEEDLLFDLVGVDAPIANSLRRVLLAEVPTMAIETVSVHDNTSIMHDEMLAHRLGLVPLRIDPAPFKAWVQGDEPTPENSVKFRLRVACAHAGGGVGGGGAGGGGGGDAHAPPEVLYVNSSVKSGLLEYAGDAAQQDALLGGAVPRPVHDDIVLAKLRPGQAIHVECDATKGIGREHAKWSPVATASYRMLTEVALRAPVRGPAAAALKELCPMGVFDIEDGAATVAHPEKCSMCRECVRGDERAGQVELTRKRDHFIFEVESAGQLPPERLVVDALSVLMDKCDVVELALDQALEEMAPRKPVEEEEEEEEEEERGADSENEDMVDVADAEE